MGFFSLHVLLQLRTPLRRLQRGTGRSLWRDWGEVFNAAKLTLNNLKPPNLLVVTPSVPPATTSIFQELATGQRRVSSDRHEPCSHLPTASIPARARETGIEGTTLKNPRPGNPNGLTNDPGQIACLSASKPPELLCAPICHNQAVGFCCCGEWGCSSLYKYSWLTHFPRRPTSLTACQARRAETRHFRCFFLSGGLGGKLSDCPRCSRNSAGNQMILSPFLSLIAFPPLHLIFR